MLRITFTCFHLKAKCIHAALITKDGTLMWKHALLYQNSQLSLPISEAHEQHIIKNCSAPRGTEQLGIPRTRALGMFFQLKRGINLTNLSYVKVSLPTLLIQLMTLTTRTQVYCHTSKIMRLFNYAIDISTSAAVDNKAAYLRLY